VREKPQRRNREGNIGPLLMKKLIPPNLPPLQIPPVTQILKLLPKIVKNHLRYANVREEPMELLREQLKI
jgi:hypothetical protein